MEQLKNESKIERIESDTRSKILKQSIVMTENRNARSTMEDDLRSDMSAHSNQWAGELARREESWVVASQIDSLSQRSTTLNNSKSSAQRCRNEEFIDEVVDRLLDLTDWVVTTRHLGLYHHSVIEPAPVEGEEALRVMLRPLEWSKKRKRS